MQDRSSLPIPTAAPSLRRGTALNLIGQVVPAVVAIIAIPVVQKRLGDEQLGLLMLAWALVGYLGIFDLGFRRALTHAVATTQSDDPSRNPKLIWTSLWCLTGLGVLFGLVLIGYGPRLINGLIARGYVTHTTGWLAVIGLAISLPAVGIASALRGVMEGRERFDVLNAVRIPVAIAGYLGPLASALFSPSVAPAIVVLAVTRIAGTIAMAAAAATLDPALRQVRAPSRDSLRDLASVGGWMTLANVSASAMLYLDRLFVGLLVPLRAVAYYTTPQEVLSKFLILSAATSTTAFPRLSSHFAAGSPELGRVYERATTATLIGLFVPLFGIAVLAPDWLAIWIGEAFARESTSVVWWLSLGTLLGGAAAIPLALLQAAGRSKLTAAYQAGLLPVYAALVWTLTIQYGIAGAAAAWAIRMAIECAILFASARSSAPGALQPWPIAAAAVALAVLPPLAHSWSFVSRGLIVVLFTVGTTALAHYVLGFTIESFVPRRLKPGSAGKEWR